jgi:hypothetical protein
MGTHELTTCNDSFDANLIKGMLEDNGISCYLTNENFSSMLPHFNGMLGSGINIMVDEIDFEKANKLIEKQPKVDNKLICPNCQSANVKFGFGSHRIKKIFTIVLSLLFGIPFGNIKYQYFCKDCRTEF